MKMTSRLRLKTAVRPSFRSVIFSIILLIGIGCSVSGQELRYSFKQGEILDYEIIKTGRNYVQPTEVFKYRFTVVSAERDRFSLTLQLSSLYVPRKYSNNIYN